MGVSNASMLVACLGFLLGHLIFRIGTDLVKFSRLASIYRAMNPGDKPLYSVYVDQQHNHIPLYRADPTVFIENDIIQVRTRVYSNAASMVIVLVLALGFIFI